MMDEIMNELWQVKDSLAKENDCNIRNLVRELQKKEKSKKKIYDFSDITKKSVSNL